MRIKRKPNLLEEYMSLPLFDKTRFIVASCFALYHVAFTTLILYLASTKEIVGASVYGFAAICAAIAIVCIRAQYQILINKK